MSNNAGVFALASAVGAAYLTVGLHIALALPDGRPRARPGRVVVGLAYAGNAVLGCLRIATGVVCDWPFLVRCPGSPLAVPGLAEYGTTLVLVELVWLNGVAAAALILLAQRLRGSDR